MKILSGFYRSLGWLLFLNVLIKPLWIFGIDRAVQNQIGYASYGSYFSLLNFSLLFSFLLDWGFTIYFNRQIALQKQMVIPSGNFLGFKIFLLFVYVGVVIIAALVTSIDDWTILIYVIAVQVFTSLLLFFRAIITGQQMFRTDAWLSVLDKSLMILFCGFFLWLPTVGNITLAIFLQAQVFCTVLANLVAIFILWRNGSQLAFNFRFPGKEMLRSALPFALIVLLMSVHYRLDGFLLQQLRGDEEAGSYAAAYRLLDAANIPGFLLASFLLPWLVRHQNSPHITSSTILFCRHLLVLLSLLVSISCFFLADWGQITLYKNSGPAAIELLKYCLPAILAYSLVHIYGTMLTASGYIYEFCFITLVAVLINVAANTLLIPMMGANGCAISALISQYFYALTTTIYAAKKCSIPFDARSWGLYIFIGTMLAGCYYLCGLMEINPVLQLMVAVLVLIACWITFWKPFSIKAFTSNQ